MIDKTGLPQEIIAILEQNLKGQEAQITFPPPVFIEMQGKLVDFNLAEQSLSIQFPILDKYLNPYGSLQGGIIAALIDNTIGPLSMLVAAPNVTRHLELKYSRPCLPEDSYVLVKAQCLEQEGKRIHFEAKAYNPKNKLLVSAKAQHIKV